MSLHISSKKQGAELTSIKYDNKEMLHQGKEYWNRHAPILFPIVGQIKNGETIINGKTYKMNQHGFARDMEFEELEKTNKIHKYVLKSNNQTLQKFPFEFELYITYRVKDNEIITKYTVINKDKKEMIFGIGGHPAFICDYSSGNYEIEFEKKENQIKFLQLEDGLISNNLGNNLLKNNRIQLQENTFKNDAIIMTNINSNKVFLRDKIKKINILELDFTGFPYLALWSKMKAPFICIEPWFNTADKINSDGKFINKENILHLEPHKKFECEYKVKFL